MSMIVWSLASADSASPVMNVFRLSCQRPCTPAAFRIFRHTVLKLVQGFVGSVGGFPARKTNHSGFNSLNFFTYQAE